MKGRINWSLIAKKAWKTRRKNQGIGERVQRKAKVESEKLSDEDKMMMRIFSEEYVVGDEEIDKLNREMVKKMKRKTLMERALGVYQGNGIEFGGSEKKFKIERGSWGVKIGGD